MSVGVSFGGWLKQRRKDRGIGSEALAERIGCSLVALFKIESGERRPSRQVAILLAEYLGVPGDEHEAFVTFARSGQADIDSTSESAASAPWRAARKHKTNLPQLLTHLIGREKEVEEAQGLIMQTRVRLVTLTGPPGIGKTRLATQVASQLLGDFDDGVFWVELATIDDPELLLVGTARALGLKESGERSIEETLLGYLQERRMLLVLDNFEHLLDAAPAVSKLMENSPWVKVLATSREALHLRGEKRYSVPPLALPDMNGPITVRAMSEQPSVALFVERAEEVDPDFELSDDNVEDVAAVVSRLEGLPMAIELAAARAGQLSPLQMRDSLKSRLEFGRSGARDLPPRQRTLRASIDWSYNLLNDEEQEVFRSLGVFVGGFTTSAMEALHKSEDGGRGRRLEVGDVLFSLASKNLIRLQKRGTPGNPDDEDRYAVLEAIREYALQLLDGSGVERQIRQRHALYFLGLAEQGNANQSGPRLLPLLACLDADYSNAMAGLSWMLSNGRNDTELAESAVLMASFLYYYWDWRGYFTEGQEWLEKAIELGEQMVWHYEAKDGEGGEEGAPDENEARLLKIQGRILNAAGLTAWTLGNYGKATGFYNNALWALTKQRNKKGMAAVLSNLAILELEQGKYEESIEIYEKVLEIESEIRTDRNPLSLNNMGVAYWDSGKVEKAREMYEESLALYRKGDDLASTVLALDNLGIVATYYGEYEEARRYQEEALTICRTLGYSNSLAHVLANMGSRAVEEGEYGAAREFYREVLPLVEQQGYQHVIISCVDGVAKFCFKQARPIEAARLWGAAEKMREVSKHPVTVPSREQYERNVESARGMVEGDGFGVAWEEGRGMSTQDALGYAVGVLGV